jgi:hypothetical protein
MDTTLGLLLMILIVLMALRISDPDGRMMDDDDDDDMMMLSSSMKHTILSPALITLTHPDGRITIVRWSVTWAIITPSLLIAIRIASSKTSSVIATEYRKINSSGTVMKCAIHPMNP